MFPFFYNEATHLRSVSQWSVYQPIYLNSGWDPYMVWIQGCFSISQYAPFSTQQLEQKWTGTQQEIWGSAHHFQTLFFRQVWQDINSVKKERGKKPHNNLEIFHFEENGDGLALNGRQVLPVCDMSRAQTSNLCPSAVQVAGLKAAGFQK